MAGLVLDPWEQDVLRGMLGETADGRWAAYECGLCVPRQNGKGSILEARELAGLILFPHERLLIHSAHEQVTATEHYKRLLSLFENSDDLRRRVRNAPKGKGQEAIELSNGSRIFFKTRTQAGGRGLTGDLIVLDEAMILPEAIMDVLVPTMAARSLHGNPQLVYTGSAVDREKHENGLVFSQLRARALRGAERTMYMEWSVDAEDPGDISESVRKDLHSWAQANPGMGIRISPDFIEMEAGGAIGARGFCVERLGVGAWFHPDQNPGQVITTEDWNRLIDEQSQIEGRPAFVIDVNPERTWSSISAAGKRADGKFHVETVEHERGTEWVIPAAAELAKEFGVGVAYDARGQAASLADGFAESEPSVQLLPLDSADVVKACGEFYDGVVQDHLRHLDCNHLLAAVKSGVKRTIGDSTWVWSRKNSTADITPLVGATLAYYCAKTGQRPLEPFIGWSSR